MNRFSFLAVCVVLLLSVSEVSAARPSVSVLPAKSVAVVNVDWTEVRNSVDLRGAIKGDDFVAILRQIGIDEAKVNEFSVFADVNPTSANKMGLIVSGRFRLRDVVGAIQRRNWSVEKIGKRTAFLNPADGSLVLPLAEGLLVTGTRNGVAQTAATFDKPRTGLIHKKAFGSIFSLLGEGQPIRGFVGVPQEYQMAGKVGMMGLKFLLHIGFFTPLGMVLSAMTMIQSVGLSIADSAGDVPVHMVLQTGGSLTGSYASSASAKALNLLKSAASMSPSADQRALASMKVVDAKGYLSIRMRVPKGDAEIH